MSVPYMYFSKKTLAKCADAKPGDLILCEKCGGKHRLLAPDDWDGQSEAHLLFYKCPGKGAYLAAVAGKLVQGIEADASGRLG